jgi:outer membrane protein TolC
MPASTPSNLRPEEGAASLTDTATGGVVVPTTPVPTGSLPTGSVPTSPAAPQPTLPPSRPPATPRPPDADKNPIAAPPTTAPGSPAPAIKPAVKPGTAPTNASGLAPADRLPEYMNPLPNPLQFPTKIEEVTLKGVQPITLSQAIELAGRNNRTLEQARIQRDRSQAALREANAALSPTVFVQGDFSRSKSAGAEISNRRRIDGLEEDLESSDLNRRFQAQQQEDSIRAAARDADDPTTQINVALNINYDLFTAGARPNQIKAAQKQVRLAELELERVQSQLYFDVANDYYDLQDADAQVQIAADAVASARSNLKDADAQFKAGLGTKFDVLRANVQLANNEQQLTSNVASREVRRRQIAQRLSLRETIGVIAADPVVKSGDWPLSLEQSIILAYRNRAELEQQLVQRDISEARRKVALAALGPTVTLNGQLNFLDIFEQSMTTIGSGYSVGVQARWTLFDGGAASARAAQQSKDIELADSRFAEARNAVRFEVERAYATLLSNQASIVTAETAVQQADEALRLAILRFQAGVGTQTDRINAEADLTRARGNRTSAVIGYNRSLAQLRRAVSNLTSDTSQTSLLLSK